MISLKTYFRTSIGKKFLVALTGIVLSVFVLTHMAGNMLILVSAEAYNRYAHGMISNPLLPIAELGLVAALLVHMGLAISLALANRSAKAGGASDQRTPFASRSMIFTGLLVFVFLVLHLWTFKYGPYYATQLDGHEIRDMYRLIVEKFHEPLYIGWYVFSLLVLGIHLSHGISAIGQTIGCRSSTNCTLRRIAIGFSILVVGGFLSQPLYIFFGGGAQ